MTAALASISAEPDITDLNNLDYGIWQLHESVSYLSTVLLATPLAPAPAEDLQRLGDEIVRLMNIYRTIPVAA